MSQSCEVTKEGLRSETSVRQRRRGGSALLKLVLHRFCVGVVLFFAGATGVLAQQAEAVKSTQAILCDNKNYDLRLVRTEAPIGSQSARALAIVLTTEDATATSKMFGLYWINAPTALPTRRDDTKGAALDSALTNYGDGQTSGKEPVVQSFFREAKCLSKDAQVLAVQDLLDKKLASYPTDLSGIARALQGQGVAFDSDQPAAAPAETLTSFQGLKDEIGFARATREYVTSLLAADGVVAVPTGTPRSRDDEKKVLTERIAKLEGDLKQEKAEKDSFFGSAPLWLIFGFIVTSFIAIAVLGFIGFSYYQNLPNGEEPRRSLGQGGPLGISGKGASKRLRSEILNKLPEIVSASRTRWQEIEKTFPDVRRSDPQNQAGDGQDNLSVSIQRLGNMLRDPHQKQSRRVIEDELNTATRLADQYRLEADSWYGAFSDLQNRLEGLQQGLPEVTNETGTPNAQAPSTSIGAEVPVAQGMTPTLNQFGSDIRAMKTSVDGFDAKLKKYFETNESMRRIGTLWYGQHYSEKQADTLVRDVEEVIALHRLLSKQCGPDNVSITQTKQCLISTLDRLKAIRDRNINDWTKGVTEPHEIAARVEAKLSNDSNVVKDYDAINELLKGHFANPRKASEMVSGLISQISMVMEKLGRFHSGQSVVEVVDFVVATYEAVTEEVRRAMPDQSGTVRELVTTLSTGYRDLKPVAENAQLLENQCKVLARDIVTAKSQLQAGRDLVGEVAVELNFQKERLTEDDSITGMLGRLKNERASSVYLQLRLGLSAALIALERTTGAGSSDEQREVIEALLVEKIKTGIEELLARMENYSGRELWNEGLSAGFGQKWLHYLIRADLLLRTYYAGRSEFGPLRNAVSLACSSMLAALSEFQVEVVEVGLFGPLPEAMETEPVYQGIRSLSAVKEKVRLKIQDIKTERVVVDVTSFPFFVNGVQENRGRASIANPSAWLQH
jgi:hypothetical protein